MQRLGLKSAAAATHMRASECLALLKKLSDRKRLETALSVVKQVHSSLAHCPRNKLINAAKAAGRVWFLQLGRRVKSVCLG